MDTAREPRIIKADRRSRVVLAVCVIIVFLVGAMAISLTPRVQSYLQGQDPRVALCVLQAFTAAVFLSFLPLSGYLFWLGRRAVRSRQMPPPGTWVMRDTRVIAGEVCGVFVRMLSIGAGTSPDQRLAPFSVTVRPHAPRIRSSHVRGFARLGWSTKKRW